MSLSITRCLGVAAAVLAVAGCTLTPGSLAREVVRASAPEAINASLRALNDGDNQRLMLELMNSPSMREGTAALARSLADAATGTLSEPERMARIDALTAHYLTDVVRSLTRALAAGLRHDLGPALAASLRQDLGPAMTAAMRDAVGGALQEVLREGTRRGLEQLAEGLTRAAADGATRGLAEGITRDLTPALRAALGPGNGSLLTGTTRTVAREVVLGSNDAMNQLQRDGDRAGHPSFLTRLSRLTENGMLVLKLVAAIAVALCGLFAVWAVRLIMRSRRLQAESQRNAASAVLFAQAIRSAEGRPWATELTDLLHQRLEGGAVTAMIDQVLAPAVPGKRGRSASRGRVEPPPLRPHHDAA